MQIRCEQPVSQLEIWKPRLGSSIRIGGCTWLHSRNASTLIKALEKEAGGAWHSLRKLHSSDHDFIHVAIRQCRSSAGSDDMSHGTKCDRHYWNTSTHRHREEERHDGGLRDRGRARARYAPAASYLSSVPAAFPAYLDDDNGCLVWCVTLNPIYRNGGAELRRPLGIRIVGGSVDS